ncbi:KGGVGR-motif variant AAA ATPase [Kriegella aquimaris]|uniref:Tetratricopeptide repeat-containing protein n=1 Tax=Kriegella aquimaris TaxID=192904 RepID=A0A1G9IGY4_9FLAO|nr:AAA family ATPase [Kriegella aquimaris]SDL24295.1 Tetratricopeptide repeat-containing protein [Kriegella aquimaris]
MKTITFYSYKGGVGRSLTLSNIAMRLADLGKKVCLVDFDLEAPGLHLKFSDYIESSELKKGVVEYISDFQNDGFLPDTFDSYLLKIHYDSTLSGAIYFFPAGNLNTNAYWKKLSSISWKELFYSKNNLGVELLLNLKEKIKNEINPDFLLIDSRTGITDISGMAMTLLSDSVVILAANNKENLIGSRRIIKGLKNDSNNLTGKLPKTYCVLTRIPYYPNPEEKYKETRMVKKALHTINKDEKLIDKLFVIHSDPALEVEEEFKINYLSKNTKNVVPIEEDYLTLFKELTTGDLDQKQIDKFNKLRESEYLIEEALNSRDNALRLKKLKEALELNTDSDEIHSMISITYGELESYHEALEYIEKAINLNEDEPNYKVIEAHCYLSLKKYNLAEKKLLKLLAKHSNNFEALHVLTVIKISQGQFEKALKYSNELLELAPEDHNIYNLQANVYKGLGDYEKAFKSIYKALEIKPNSIDSTGTLAELYLAKGDYKEFYKNFQLALVFGMDSKYFQEVLSHSTNIYRPLFEDEKFTNLLEKYRIKVKLPE